MTLKFKDEPYSKLISVKSLYKKYLALNIKNKEGTFDFIVNQYEQQIEGFKRKFNDFDMKTPEKNGESFSPIRHRNHNIFTKSKDRRDKSTSKSPHRKIVTTDDPEIKSTENTPRFKNKFGTIVDSVKNIFGNVLPSDNEPQTAKKPNFDSEQKLEDYKTVG